MTVTLEQLSSFFEDTDDTVLQSYLDPINLVTDKYEINTTKRLAMFLAQVGFESSGLKVVHENLNYRAERISQVFPKYFHGVNTADYAHNPEALANRVYADRMGNGDEDSGDGWKFHGRGPIQITGKSNYQNFANKIGKSLDETVDYIETPEGGMMAAGWFWGDHDLNDLADAGNVAAVTRKINGGDHGLADRTSLYKEALTIF